METETASLKRDADSVAQAPEAKKARTEPRFVHLPLVGKPMDEAIRAACCIEGVCVCVCVRS